MAGDDRYPRGAIAVVVAGILLTLFVAWISDERIVATTPLEWSGQHADAIPPAAPGEMADNGAALLTSSGMDVTEPNSEGERLFQVGMEVRIAPGRSPATTRVTCVQQTEPPTVNARTPNRPAAFPGVIDELSLAEWPEQVDVNHRDQGSPFSTVSLPSAYEGYGTVDGVSVDWGDWQSGRQIWNWTAPAEAATETILIRAVSLWRTIEIPAIEIDCAVSRDGEQARLSTGGDLGG